MGLKGFYCINTTQIKNCYRTNFFLPLVLLKLAWFVSLFSWMLLQAGAGQVRGSDGSDPQPGADACKPVHVRVLGAGTQSGQHGFTVHHDGILHTPASGQRCLQLLR